MLFTIPKKAKKSHVNWNVWVSAGFAGEEFFSKSDPGMTDSALTDWRSQDFPDRWGSEEHA